MCAIVAFLAMCDSSEPDENRPLSEEETVGLLEGMMAVMADTMPQITAIHGPEEFTIACPQGGEARARISATDNASGDTVSTGLGINFVPAGCGIKGSEGTDFVLDANPGVDYSLNIRIVGFFDDFGIDGGLAGTLDWMVETRSGTCSMDMDLEAELDLLANPPGTMAFLTGDACDHALRLDVSSVVSPENASSFNPHSRESL